MAFFIEIRHLATPGVTQLVLDFQCTERADTPALRELVRLQTQLSRTGLRLNLFRRLLLAD